MSTFSLYGINSGPELKRFLDCCGLNTKGVAIKTSSNVIYLSDYVTLNWKSRNGQVRVNCKEDMMHIIEQNTNVKHQINGPGDTTHGFSFLLDNMGDLVDIIYVLRHYGKNA